MDSKRHEKWYNLLHDFLVGMPFERSKVDATLYARNKDEFFILFLVHVYYILIFSSVQEKGDRMVRYFANKF